MNETVNINREALEKLFDFVRKDLENSHLETIDNEDLKYIIDVTDALMSAKYSLGRWKNSTNVFIELKYLEFLAQIVQDCFDFIAPDTDWNCLSDMLETNLLANALLKARQAMQIEPETKEE